MENFVEGLRESLFEKMVEKFPRVGRIMVLHKK